MSSENQDLIAFNPDENARLAIEKIEAARQALNTRSAPDKASASIQPHLREGATKLTKMLPKISFLRWFGIMVVINLFMRAYDIKLPKLGGSESGSWMSPIITGVLLLFIYLQMTSRHRNKQIQKHHASYLDDVMLPTFNRLQTNLSYTRDKSIYEKHQPFFEKNFTAFHAIKSEDMIEGDIDGVHIDLGEILVGIDRYINRENEVRYNAEHRFLFFAAEFNKNIQNETILHLKKFNTHYPAIVTTKRKSILLENQQFNDIYTTYAQDEIEARYILTPSFMEKIVQLSQEIHGCFWFQNNAMFFLGTGIKGEINLFDIDAETPVYEQAEATFMTVQSLMQLVKELNLSSIAWKSA